MEFSSDPQFRASLRSVFAPRVPEEARHTRDCSVRNVAVIAVGASFVTLAAFYAFEHIAGLGLAASAAAAIALVAGLSAALAMVFPRFPRDFLVRETDDALPSSAYGLMASLVDTMPAAIVIKDNEGRYVAMNQTFLDWFGIEHARDILGKTAEDVFPANEAQIIAQNDQDALARDGFAEHEMDFTMPDGSGHCVLSRRYAVKGEHGEVAAVAVVNIDITEIKRARDEVATLLREREEQAAILQGFFDAFPFPIALKKLDGELIRLNPVTKGWWGVEPEEMIGGRSEQFLPASVAGKALELDRMVLKSKQPETLDGQVKCFDGKVRDVVMARFPLFAEEKNLIALGGFVLDVTEQRMVERLLRDMNIELEQQVDARTNELQTANAGLHRALDEVKRTTEKLIEAEKLAALAPMVAGVAHEINTPVGTAVTAASLIQERVESLEAAFAEGDLTKASMCEHLSDIRDSAGILLKNLAQANDLVRSFKQVSADQSSPSLRRIRLKEYLREVLTTLTPRIREDHLQIELECDESLEINTDPGALSQVISNLLVNCSLHAYPDKSGGRVVVRVRHADEHTRLEFQDFGKGIAPDDMKNIFIPFFTTCRGEGGTGLGLSIVYNIVTSRLSGAISCQSEPGAGSLFTLTLPELAIEAGDDALKEHV